MKTDNRRPWHPTQAELRYLPREALEEQWSFVIRRAAGAQFPRQTVELRSAAYLAGHLVVAERYPEDKAKDHLRAAAKRAGIRPVEADRAIADAYLQGRAHALGELSRGGIEHQPPGAFSAVASAQTTYDYENDFHIDPLALVPLPRAVLVHRGHDLRKAPVAIAVPVVRDGAVHIDGVFASQQFGSEAGPAWTLVRTKRIRGVSIYAATNEFHRGVDGRLVSGTLVSVDLVRTPADDKASIGEITPAASMTTGQRQTQHLLDRYLADERNPLGRDLHIDACQRGAAALDILAPVVAPMVAERARSLAGVRR